MAKRGDKSGGGDFGAAIKAARKRLDMTIADVAYEADISPSMLSRIESGKRPDVRLSTAGRLCRVLRISLDRLLGLSDDPKAIAKQLRELGETKKDVQRLLDRLKS